MIDFLIGPAIPRWEAEQQAAHARGLGLPSPRPRHGNLAVVGGAHSVNAYVETLRRFDGDVWAINGAYGWCKERGINATFFTVDPEDVTVKFAIGAKKAIVTPWCHPTMWEALKDADLELADFFPPFSASAPNVSAIAFDLGYRSITYFGCDCSFSDQTHTYQNHADPATMVVRCGGLDYLTTPAYYVQAKELASLCREFRVCREMSGGLFRALVSDFEHEVVEMAPSVAAKAIQYTNLDILEIA